MVKESWRECLSYPNLANSELGGRYIELLDTLETLIGFPKRNDKYSQLADFLEIGCQKELINKKEYANIRSRLAPLL